MYPETLFRFRGEPVQLASATFTAYPPPAIGRTSMAHIDTTKAQS